MRKIMSIYMCIVSVVIIFNTMNAAAYNDYPYKNASSYGVDPWNFYNRQCTSFVAWRMNRDAGRTSAPYAFMNWMNGFRWGHARDWDDTARNLGYTVNNTPKAGAIAHWGPWEGGAYGYGHVAYVESVNADGSVNLSEYNWINPLAYYERYGVHAARYIHVNTNPYPDPKPEPEPEPEPEFTVSGRIDDNFIGKGWENSYSFIRHYNNDVLATAGYQDDFDLYWMDYNITETRMTLDIRTDYSAGRVPGVNQYLTTSYGDLFLSVDGWTADSERWEYVFDVDTGNLYDIREHQNLVLLSNDVYDGRDNPQSYRLGQEIEIDPTGLTAIGTGSANKNGDYYSLSFDITELALDLMNLNLGFHWGMSCANDIIEGGVVTSAVPEPGTIALLGFGVLGLIGFKRKLNT